MFAQILDLCEQIGWICLLTVLFNGNVWNILDIVSGFFQFIDQGIFFCLGINGEGAYRHVIHNVYILIFGYSLDYRGLKWDLLFIQ